MTRSSTSGVYLDSPHAALILDAISTRLLTTFAAGPAGRAHPAVDNLATLNIKPGAHNASAPDVD
jgi:hypothetical protein